MHASLALALKAQTSTIPIVAVNSDPVALGLVPNLAHPGGNVTGVSIDAGLGIWGKRLALLSEAAGRMTRPYFLTNAQQWGAPTGKAIREAAQRLGLSITPALLAGDIDRSAYVRAFDQAHQGEADALIVSEIGENITYRRTITELAAQYALPAIYPYREFVTEGGLMAYSIDLPDTFRTLANQIVKIFAGTNPAEIPFVQQTKFQLIVNLKAAKALGTALPSTLLASADELLE